jgi:hypothetical protein
MLKCKKSICFFVIAYDFSYFKAVSIISEGFFDRFFKKKVNKGITLFLEEIL